MHAITTNFAWLVPSIAPDRRKATCVNTPNSPGSKRSAVQHASTPNAVLHSMLLRLPPRPSAFCLPPCPPAWASLEVFLRWYTVLHEEWFQVTYFSNYQSSSRWFEMFDMLTKLWNMRKMFDMLTVSSRCFEMFDMLTKLWNIWKNDWHDNGVISML